MRQALSSLVDGCACRVRMAENIEQALAWQAAEPADIVLFDDVLPLAGRFRCLPEPAPLLIALADQQGWTDRFEMADEYFFRPVESAFARTRLQQLLDERAAGKELEEAETVLVELAQTVERRVPCTRNHCQRLSELSVRLGQAMGFAQESLWILHRGAYLHDIGKVYTPDEVLLKCGWLTPAERVVMEAHVIDGEQICRPLRTLKPILPLIRHHHERWDGRGYPDGLAGDEIPVLAQVLQVADIFDALTHDRPYKPALPPQEAIDLLLDEAKRGWRDPEVVSLFAAVMRPQ